MKKIFLFTVLFFIIFQGIMFFSDKMDQEFFDSYYAEMKNSEDNEPNLWEKTKVFFEELFRDKEERFIYK